VPGTPLFEEQRRGDFVLPSPEEILLELRVLLDRMRLSGAVFRSNHASNWLPLAGRLPADRERLLAAVDAALSGAIPLVPDEWRGL
jgi:hypothetical protein